MDYIYGRSCVWAALNSSKRQIKQLLVYERKNNDITILKDILKLAIDKNIAIQYTTDYHLNRLSQGRPHQVSKKSSFHYYCSSDNLLLQVHK